MKNLKQYLKEKFALLWTLALSLVVYIVSFKLWHLPMRPLFNTSLFVVLILITYLAYDYHKWLKDKKAYKELKDEYNHLKNKLDETIIFDKNLTDIVKVWSHQMKVPLSSIDLMIQTDDVDLHTLKLQIFQIDNYLNLLLEYLRLNSTSTDYRFDKFDAKDVTTSLLRKYAPQFIAKDISVNIEGNWELVADKKWFSVALEQIINNAVKYTNSGSVSFLMDGKSIFIKDTGIGILSEDLPRLFEHGFTGYNGRLEKKSTGLGLYLAKTILSHLELDIEIESQVDKGTTVKISKK